MSKEETLDSVFGGATPAANAGDAANDKDARIAELERQLQKERVESGRLKKANEEIEGLKGQLAQLQSKKAEEDAISALPEDLRNDVPEDFVRAAAKIQVNADRRRDEEMAKMREELARRDRESFAQRIESAYPGFLNRVSAGGDWNGPWNKYKQYNANSINSAFASGDFETLSYHIGRFCNEVGVSIPSGGGSESTIPDPRSSQGGSPSVDAMPGLSASKVYTVEEYNSIERTAEDYRRNGQFTKYQQLAQEMERILSEGRLKG